MLRITAFALVAAAFTAVPPVHAQVGSNGLIPPPLAQRYGLERSWYTQIELDRSRSRIAHITPHVSSSHFTIVHEVRYDGGKIQFSENERDRFGDRIGPDRALALARRKIESLRELGMNPVLNTREIPVVTLYVQTDRGVLTAVDGETGRSKWSVLVGRPDHPTLEPGASDAHVAVVNGSNLFVLDAEDGSTVWRTQLGGAPGAGPAVSDQRVFCPLFNGQIETYRIDQPKAMPWIHQSSGHALLQPTVAPTTVSWATARGTFYVAFINRDFVRYRLQALDAIVAPAAWAPRRWFVGSLDGYLYALHEYSGAILWRFPAAAPIRHQPVVLGGKVFCVADGEGMYCLDPESGEEIWSTPDVSQFLAASKDKVYCLNETGRILIIDQQTGGHIATIPVEGLDLHLVNWRTDRIYVGNRMGVLQCLHEPEHSWPMVHQVMEAAEPDTPRPEVRQRTLEEAAEERPAAPPRDPFGGATDDPFGPPADPFGGGGGAGADPFGRGGAGADPFGGGGGAGADPFGGGGAGADPFGG